MKRGGRMSESGIVTESENGIVTETEIGSETGKEKRRDLVPKMVLLKKKAKRVLSHGPQRFPKNTGESVKTPEPICSSPQLCLNTSHTCLTCMGTRMARVMTPVTQDTEECPQSWCRTTQVRYKYINIHLGFVAVTDLQIHDCPVLWYQLFVWSLLCVTRYDMPLCQIVIVWQQGVNAFYPC